MDQHVKMLQLKNMMGAQSMQDMQLRQAEQGIQDDQATRQFYAGLKPGEDARGRVGDLMRVNPKAGREAQKFYQDSDKSTAELMKHDDDLVKSYAAQGKEQLKSITSQEQWSAFRDLQIQRAGMLSTPQYRNVALQHIQQMPPQFNPQWIQSQLAKTEGFATPEYKPVAAGGSTVMTQTNPNAPGFSAAPIAHTATPEGMESARHNRATEAQAMAAADRDKYGQPIEVTGPDGKPRLVVANKGGGLFDANTLQPVQGVGPKVGEAAQKQQTGVQNTVAALGEYQKALKDFSLTDIANPNARAKMGTVYNNALLQAKEAFNLGVLNGPDYQILQEVLTNPTSIKGGLTSKEALNTQATKLTEIMGRIGQQVTATQSGLAPQQQAPAVGPTRAQIDAELKRRGVKR